MDAIGIARTGLATSMARLGASAARVANASVTGAGPDSRGVAGAAPASALASAPAPASAPASTVNLAQEAVNQLVARQDARANLAVIRTATELDRNLLELWG